VKDTITSSSLLVATIFPTFLWFAEIYAKDYILKLLSIEANMLTVRDIVGDVKPTSPRSGNSANVVE
jgi:hypothetical protein